MGNVRNFLRDLRAGLATHTFAQLQYLRSIKNRYDLAAAVGDTFAYVMARRAAAKKTVFVGTAKSVYVARYGPGELRALRSADAIFVRDAATANDLRARGAEASAPGNVIVDLFDEDTGSSTIAGNTLAIFPGSRESAYGDAVFAASVVRALKKKLPQLTATLSIAPGLDVQRFAQVLRDDGWDVLSMSAPSNPFTLAVGHEVVITAWTGSPGAMLKDAQLVLGQAGTVNEAAAARGIPVVAFHRSSSANWYRRRQRGLLDGALMVTTGSEDSVAGQLLSLLRDETRRHAMSTIGRSRMGPPGGARSIASRLSELVQ